MTERESLSSARQFTDSANELREAQTEMRRCLSALYLELPEAVWSDVNKRTARLWNAAWDAVNAARAAGHEEGKADRG